MADHPITLALVDDHRAFRQALKIALEQIPSLSIVIEANNGLEFFSMLRHTTPDIAIVDIRMPAMNGIEVLKVLQEKHPSIRPLVLSAFIDEVYVAECLKYGINGFLSKDMDISEIVMAVRRAARNEVHFTNLLSNNLLRSYISQNNKDNSSLLPDFSSEEIKIAELLKNEHSTDEISRILFLSKRSIETKREKMKAKASVKTTGGLILYFLKRGLID